MSVLKTINFKEDYVFKYVFGKDDIPNREALKSLISDFTNCKVEDLQVKSPELKCGTKYEKNTLFDIYAEFNHGKKIDIEMQMVRKKNNLSSRMLIYLGKMLSAQLQQGEEYSSVKECYILMILDFKMYYDTKLVHKFGIYTEDGTPFDEDKQLIHIITVELPKIKNVIPASDEEKWAYILYNSHDKTRLDEIKRIGETKEGIAMALEAANHITQEEQDWFDDYQKQRGKMEEASFGEEVLDGRFFAGEQVGLEKGEKIGFEKGEERTNIKSILAIQDILCVDEIAKRLDLEVAFVQSVIDSNK